MSTTSYRFGRLLGKGSFSSVYEAVKDGHHVAIKMVNKSILHEPDMRARLVKEVEVHMGLQHPHIVQLLEFFEDSDRVYLVMELCSRGELLSLVQQKGRLGDREARSLFRQLLEAVAFLHSQGILHRDIKLANILLTAEGQVKLADFGLAAVMESPDCERHTICGTPNYIAAEIAQQQPYSMAADVWSLGVVLFAMLTGKPPFQADKVAGTLERVRTAELQCPACVGPQAADLLQRLLVKDPTKRLTLDAALRHPFVLQRRDADLNDSVFSLSAHVQRLQMDNAKDTTAGFGAKLAAPASARLDHTAAALPIEQPGPGRSAPDGSQKSGQETAMAAAGGRHRRPRKENQCPAPSRLRASHNSAASTIGCSASRETWIPAAARQPTTVSCGAGAGSPTPSGAAAAGGIEQRPARGHPGAEIRSGSTSPVTGSPLPRSRHLPLPTARQHHHSCLQPDAGDTSWPAQLAVLAVQASAGGPMHSRQPAGAGMASTPSSQAGGADGARGIAAASSARSEWVHQQRSTGQQPAPPLQAHSQGCQAQAAAQQGQACESAQADAICDHRPCSSAQAGLRAALRVSSASLCSLAEPSATEAAAAAAVPPILGQEANLQDLTAFGSAALAELEEESCAGSLPATPSSTSQTAGRQALAAATQFGGSARVGARQAVAGAASSMGQGADVQQLARPLPKPACSMQQQQQQHDCQGPQADGAVSRVLPGPWPATHLLHPCLHRTAYGFLGLLQDGCVCIEHSASQLRVYIAPDGASLRLECEGRGARRFAAASLPPALHAFYQTAASFADLLACTTPRVVFLGQAGARASLLVSGQLQLSLGQQWGHVAQVVLCREGHTGQVTCCAGDAFTVQAPDHRSVAAPSCWQPGLSRDLEVTVALQQAVYSRSKCFQVLQQAEALQAQGRQITFPLVAKSR